MSLPIRFRALDLQGIHEMLARVASGELTPDEAAAWLDEVPVLNRDDVEPDVVREARTGQPEVIYGPGKTPAQVVAVARALMRADVRPILLTRATEAQVRAVRKELSEAVHHAQAGLVVIRSSDQDPAGTIAVVSAGTSDLPVAEEAALVAEAFGLRVDRIVDVGVAGIHRVLAQVPTLERADCVIVVAGMEGALPSVVAGLISAPVVAVPTSVGYGASFGGLAALLGMLSSCVPGVVTVNVDNGLGAAMAAHRIVRR
jgi:NCAIR mutase (PurE)-related protein